MSNPTGIVYLLDDELGMVKAVTRLLRARGFEGAWIYVASQLSRGLPSGIRQLPDSRCGHA